VDVGAHMHWQAGWGGEPWQTSGGRTARITARIKMGNGYPASGYLTLQP
jgi:hypothetical protein